MEECSDSDEEEGIQRAHDEGSMSADTPFDEDGREEEMHRCPDCSEQKRLAELWHGGMRKEIFDAFFSDSKPDLYYYCVGCHNAKEENDRRREQIRLDTEARLHGYLCPEFSGYRTNDDSAWSICPNLEFSPAQPNLDDLVGDYDILFFASRTNHRARYSRKSKGKLFLSQPQGALRGKVVMDESVHHCVVPKPGCFTFRDTGYWDDERRSQCLKVLEFPDDFVPGFQTWSPGYLKTVATQAAVPRWPDSGCWHPPRWEVQFDSIEEARRIQRNYFHSNQHSWIHNHLNLPESVGSLIAQFVVPPPLFFFEPGDLWLHMRWDENDLYAEDDGLETIILARRAG
jgi:hypothetical protein